MNIFMPFVKIGNNICPTKFDNNKKVLSITLQNVYKNLHFFKYSLSAAQFNLRRDRNKLLILFKTTYNQLLIEYFNK